MSEAKQGTDASRPHGGREAGSRSPAPTPDGTQSGGPGSTGDAYDPVAARARFDGWAIVDLHTQMIVKANEHGRELLGLHASQLPIPLAEVLTPTDLTLATERVLPLLQNASVWHGGLRLRGSREAESPIPLIVIPHVPPTGSDEASVATMYFTPPDASLGALAVPDPLTGLATRSELFDRLDRATRRTRHTGETLAALFFDLDGLKNINDRYGHEVGDSTLIETAQRISACLEPGDLAVRFGGDEFVVLREVSASAENAVDLGQRILRTLNGIDDYQAISSSIGIAFSRGADVDALELIRQADSAMYRAKARGGDQIAIFDQAMRDRQRADQALRSNLLEAITNNGFSVAAQPIYALASGEVLGVELFIRLRDDTPYVTNANELFRLAHEHGEAIDEAIILRAIALAKQWQDDFGRQAPRVHVNVSAQSLAAAHFKRRVESAFRRQKVRPQSVAFEVDSRDIIRAGDRERSTVNGLQDFGVPIVVDGYGGDPVELTDLASWRPSMVKIEAKNLDRNVMAGMVRGVTALRIPSCIKGIGGQTQLAQAVSVGTYGGQGNALTPVRQVSRVSKLLHQPGRIGF